MAYTLCLLIAVAGSLAGGLAGAAAAGYLIIFKSVGYIAAGVDCGQWTKIAEGGLILFFTKPVIIAGAAAGGFFGAVPGIIGIAKCDENS